jgi:hypothetical protein
MVEKFGYFCGAKNRTTVVSSLIHSLTDIQFLRRPLGVERLGPELYCSQLDESL